MPMPVHRTSGSEVLVIGGGVIGLVTAWRAAQRGLAIAVVDPDPGGGAARVAAGMLAAVTELHYGEEMLLGLNLASAARYPAFAAELEAASGQDIGFRACGTLAVALDTDDRAHLRELHELQRRSGLESQWLTGRESPAPGADARAGRTRRTAGRRRPPGRPAPAVRRAADGVRAGRGRLPPAAGRAALRGARPGHRGGTGRRFGAVGRPGRARRRRASAAGLAGVPEHVRPPVRPVKGQVLRLTVPTAYAPFLSRTVRAVVRGSHLYLVPRENGELVVGATSEEMGWDTTVTAGGVYELLRDAHELVPGITELPLTETRAGLRPASPDNAPLLGRTALPGLHLATGHHRNGVLLTPVTGDAMAQLLADGELPEVARPFSPGRFPAAAPVRQEQPA